MAENTGIEWAHHTFNPWMGCAKVSPACDNCYAERDTARWKLVDWGPRADRRRTKEKTWSAPVRWNRLAAKNGVRYRVFCASLADVFDNHASIQLDWRHDLWGLITSTPYLDWLLLTKRAQNAAKYLPRSWMDGGLPPNVWMGTTVETQAEADRRIPHLLKIPARVRFLSCEPLLGPVRLLHMDVEAGHGRDGMYCINALTGRNRDMGRPCRDVPVIHWVIAGGESGPNYREADPDWYRSLRDQCADAGVPFLFKQWHGASQRAIKAQGRALDGVVHDGYPSGASFYKAEQGA